MYIKGDMVLYSGALLSVRIAVDSEAIQACVIRMTPVRQHAHLNDLKGLVILLLGGKKGKIKHGQHLCSLPNPSKLLCCLHRQQNYIHDWYRTTYMTGTEHRLNLQFIPIEFDRSMLLR